MQRWTAKLLLLYALAGTFAPAALASLGPRPHACCIRKQKRHCVESTSSPSEQLSIRSIGCYNGNCQGAVTKVQWAYARLNSKHIFVSTVDLLVSHRSANCPANQSPELQSTRAPPNVPIA
jgi:hypothetical protein